MSIATARLGVMLVLALWLGAGAHAHAGGGSPTAVALALALLIGSPLSVWVAVRGFALPRTLLTAGVQQVFIHYSFVVVGGPHLPLHGPGSHHAALAADAAGRATATHPHAFPDAAGHLAHGLPMLLMHVAAAVLVATGACQAARARTIVMRLLAPAVDLPRPHRVPTSAPPPAPWRSRAVPTPAERHGAHQHRGPPVCAHVA